ncbi:MAG: hypothetical protein ABIN61_00425 [candidate division WOR-3 bacterium]
MRKLFFLVILLVINCISNFATSQKTDTIPIYFEKISGRYGILGDKTQLYVLKNSKGKFIPVEDSLKAKYFVKFHITSSLSGLKNPDYKIYEVIAKVKAKESSSIVGITEAKYKGKWEDVVSFLSQNTGRNLVSILKRVTKTEKPPLPSEPEEVEDSENE